MKELTTLEQIILAAILRLKDDAYGISIRKTAKSLSGKSIMYGALYNVLDQLSRKGYVAKTKRKHDDLVPGGHNRIYYTLTPEGSKSLEAAYYLQKSIWASIPEFIIGLKNHE